MAWEKSDQKRLERMHKYLPIIRASIGFSEYDLAETLSISRVTINNIEKGRTQLSRVMFLAFESVFLNEMYKTEAVDALNLYYILLDSVGATGSREYTDEEVDEIASQLGHEKVTSPRKPGMGEIQRRILQKFNDILKEY